MKATIDLIEVKKIQLGWITLEQAATLAERSAETVRKAVVAHRLKAFVKERCAADKARTQGLVRRRSGWYVEESEVNQWIEAGCPTTTLRPVSVEVEAPKLFDAKPLIDSDIRLLYKMLSELTAKVEAMALEVTVLRKALE